MSNSKYELIELQAENFKRLRAVRIHPKPGAITAIVGKNGSGKTSTLDALEAALGGKLSCPKLPIRIGEKSARIIADLKEIIVERTFDEDGSSKVTVRTREGAKFNSPQKMLDALMGEISFDPLAFERMKPTEQAAIIAKMAKVDIRDYANRIEAIRDQRKVLNKQWVEAKYAIDRHGPAIEGLPDDVIELKGIVGKMEAATAHNRAIESAKAEQRRQEDYLKQMHVNMATREAKVAGLRVELENAIKAVDEQTDNIKRQSDITAEAVDATQALGEPRATDGFQKQIQEAESVNDSIRHNKDRVAKEKAATDLKIKFDALGNEIENIEEERDLKITTADMPVKGLGITEKGVSYKAAGDRPPIPFEQCSQAEKLRVSTAIGLALNSTIKVMLIRDGSLLDNDGMELLSQIAAEAGAQILVERVAAEGEVGIWITDGETEGTVDALLAEAIAEATAAETAK